MNSDEEIRNARAAERSARARFIRYLVAQGIPAPDAQALADKLGRAMDLMAEALHRYAIETHCGICRRAYQDGERVVQAAIVAGDQEHPLTSAHEACLKAKGIELPRDFPQSREEAEDPLRSGFFTPGPTHFH